MSAVPIFIGRWQDHSHNSILGDVVTLDVRWGGYLIAALSTFVGLAGTALWSLVALTVHQCRAKRDKEDGVYLQQQVIYRNPSSPIGATLKILKICWGWRKTRESNVRARRLKSRSALLALPPLIVFASFTAAGIFVSEVAGKSYQSNNVRVKAGRCGFFAFDTKDVNGERAEQQKVVNDTLAGRAYVASCYGSNSTIAECSLYPTQALPYNISQVQCPFGSDPKGENLCLFNQNSALQLDTGLIDSSDALGINAAKENRVQVRKRLTCSPLHVYNYVTVINLGDPTDVFNLGPVISGYNYTYAYLTRTAMDDVGYQITAIYAANGTWTPVEALQVPEGDVSAYFLAANSIAYLAPVQDLWFSANNPTDDLEPLPAYLPDKFVNVMGCVDQWQICNPNTDPYSCTIIGGIRDVVTAFQEIGLNEYQLATGQRIIAALDLSSTFNSVNLLGDTALLARNNLVGLVSTGLPANQWQNEVQGWFETSLAKIQAFMVEYVTNIADLGPFGYVVSPNPDGDPFNQAAASFCSEQRIRNTGGYQTFSFLGLMIVICVGGTIIILSLVVESILGWTRKHLSKNKHDYREIARIADLKLQLQRMALMGARFEEGWDHLLEDVPVTRGENRFFALPRRKEINGVVDYRYSGQGSQETLLADGVNAERENGLPAPAAIPPEHPLRGGHGDE